jgi:hypothetical protein
MRLELYKPYETRGGWKAVVVWHRGLDDVFDVWHAANNNIHRHNISGHARIFNRDYDIVAEWEEPKPPLTCHAWLNVYHDHNEVAYFCNNAYKTKEQADRWAEEGRIGCKHVVWTEGE